MFVIEIKNHIYDANIISITSKSNKAIIDNTGPTLFLFFDDIDDNELQDIGLNPIQETDAKQIAIFVNKYKNNDKYFIVNCDAGISRSSGIAAAIGKYLNNDDTFIFNNSKYCPNMRCYRMVLNALINNIK